MHRSFPVRELTLASSLIALLLLVTMSMSLPAGFRFNPTDEELIFYYLRNRAASQQCPAPIIADVDVYKFDPWDLPSKALYGDREWYFFSPRDRKCLNGTRANRAAGSGYWKSTGTDKPVHDGAIGKGFGVKKALVFYQGRAPKGTKTGWAMHEYRIAPDPLDAALNAYVPLHTPNVPIRLDGWVLCRVYNKTGQLASPLVPLLTLAGHDHDDLSGSGTQTGSVDAAGSLPTISSISKIFDDYPAAQTLDTEPEHLAVHPSLNHLFSGGDNTHVEPSYYH